MILYDGDAGGRDDKDVDDDGENDDDDDDDLTLTKVATRTTAAMTTRMTATTTTEAVMATTTTTVGGGDEEDDVDDASAEGKDGCIPPCGCAPRARISAGGPSPRRPGQGAPSAGPRRGVGRMLDCPRSLRISPSQAAKHAWREGNWRTSREHDDDGDNDDDDEAALHKSASSWAVRSCASSCESLPWPEPCSASAVFSNASSRHILSEEALNICSR